MSASTSRRALPSCRSSRAWASTNPSPLVGAARRLGGMLSLSGVRSSVALPIALAMLGCHAATPIASTSRELAAPSAFVVPPSEPRPTLRYLRTEIRPGQRAAAAQYEDVFELTNPTAFWIGYAADDSGSLSGGIEVWTSAEGWIEPAPRLRCGPSKPYPVPPHTQAELRCSSWLRPTRVELTLFGGQDPERRLVSTGEFDSSRNAPHTTPPKLFWERIAVASD